MTTESVPFSHYLKGKMTKYELHGNKCNRCGEVILMGRSHFCSEVENGQFKSAVLLRALSDPTVEKK